MKSDTMSWVLYEDDCFNVFPSIEDKSIDMILCDLPYGTTACKWDTPLPLDELWLEYKRVIKDNGAIVLTASQPFTTRLISSNYEMFKYCWIWEKPQGVDPFLTKIRPLNNYEDIIIFSKNSTKYNPQMENGKPYIITRDKTPRDYEITNTTMKETTTINDGYRYPTRIIKFKQERGMHPTQKPVKLFEYLIKTYTNEGDLVLDNCAGSGTTGVACQNLNRNCILIEKEPEYCEIIRDRMASVEELRLEARKQQTLQVEQRKQQTLTDFIPAK